MLIATWNVNGIRAREAQFTEWLGDLKPDIVCLQETKAPREKVPENVVDLPGYFSFWHGTAGYSGVAVLVRRELTDEPEFIHPSWDFEDRAVSVSVRDVRVMSMYVPNGGKNFAEKMQFLEAVRDDVEQSHRDGRRVILCGDMNVAHQDRDVHPKERKAKPVIGQLPEERALFSAILETGLIDLGRHFDPDNENLFSWWAPWRDLRQRNIGWRIDYILASESLLEGASGCIVQPEVGTSDHAPVVATMNW